MRAPPDHHVLSLVPRPKITLVPLYRGMPHVICFAKSLSMRMALQAEREAWERNVSTPREDSALGGLLGGIYVALAEKREMHCMVPAR
jgi:hypothetical protein